MTLTLWILILVGISLNAVAQLLLKFGIDKIGEFEFVFTNILPISYKLLFNYFVILGLLCYVFSVIFWIMVLSRVSVSLAYPMVSIGYIITAVAGYLFLGETITLIKVLGILIIMLGVFLISYS